VRSATDSIREARKNLSQAAGKKYVEIKPERVAAVPSERWSAEKPDSGQ